MGQYYHPCILDALGKVLMWMNAHNYNNGLKLTEHSFMKNNFVNTFEYSLTPGQRFHKSRVVWAGDYADPEEGGEKNIYSMCDEYSLIACHEKDTTEFPFIVNHTKKLFVNKGKVPNKSYGLQEGYTLHPLPILTAEGNGRGGGDDHSQSMLVGSWARDVISVEKEMPAEFIEIIFDLTE